eukprot:9575937-Alexandrium_andersonii.AAC.1
MVCNQPIPKLCADTPVSGLNTGFLWRHIVSLLRRQNSASRGHSLSSYAHTSASEVVGSRRSFRSSPTDGTSSSSARPCGPRAALSKAKTRRTCVCLALLRRTGTSQAWQAAS